MQDGSDTENRPTLSKALNGVFDASQTDGEFATATARLTSALTTASEVLVVGLDGETVLGSYPDQAALPAHLSRDIALADRDSEPKQAQDALFIAVALPSGGDAWLVAKVKSVGGATRALAFERLVALSHMSFAHFRNGDMTELRELLATLGAEVPDLRTAATRVRNFVDADLIAVALFENGSVIDVALSDQPDATKRASLPQTIEDEMSAALNGTVASPDLFVAGKSGFSAAIKAENPRRNTGFLPLLAQTAVAAAKPEIVQQRRRSKAIKWAAYALVLAGICLIPLPDTRRVPGEVISENTRTITAPLSGIVLEVSVADGDAVVADETQLARLDTSDIARELASAQADYSRALLERESARGAREAAELRNAELEAEALRARIDLLEARRTRAVILAPIDGSVVGNELSSLVGATVRQGDPLLDVVNPSTLALRLDVPDDLLLRIEDGEAGVFRPDFDPSQRYDGQVQTVSPAQSTRSDIAVFEGRASLEAEGSNLRPGLRGVFVFDREFRLFGQIVYTAIRDWVMLRLWL